ncbi:hypothetical protein Lal_00026203 [Lupinus albus]|nr:hypothetical protein Lal_00026203 [Lupinus albus]
MESSSSSLPFTRFQPSTISQVIVTKECLITIIRQWSCSVSLTGYKMDGDHMSSSMSHFVY